MKFPGIGITFFNQWKKTRTEFSVIIFEYKSIYDLIDGSQDNILILGLLGFGMVIAFNV